MRLAIRYLFAPALLLPLTALAAGAEEFSDAPVFSLAPSPGPGEPKKEVVDDDKGNPKDLPGASANIRVRPNTASEFALYVRNPSNDDKSFVVELSGGPGSGLQVQVQVPDVPGGKWKRVRLPKLKAAPPPAPVPTTGAAPAAPPEPLPPGVALPPTSSARQFTLRLLDEKKAPVRNTKDGKAYGRDVQVTIQAPSEYVKVDAKNGLAAGRVVVEAVVTPVKGAAAGTGVATLAFPFAPTGKSVILGGIYRRTLDLTRATAAELRGGLRTERPGAVRIYIGVDGLDRAFIYSPDPAGTTEKMTQALSSGDKAVRVYSASGFATEAATQPVAWFPVRVEVDNAAPGDTLELRVRPAGTTDDRLAEIIRLGDTGQDRVSTRDESVWVDTAGPLDQGVLVTARSRDWVKPIDVRSLRGHLEVFGVLRNAQGNEIKEINKDASWPLRLTVDATPPEDIRFVGMLAEPGVGQLQKGKPLRVAAWATDLETRVVKATFFLGEPTEDGKIPAGAITAPGRQAVVGVTAIGQPLMAWVGDLPIPPDRRGEMTLGVQFVNAVGLAETQIKTIELVDPAAPGGGGATGTIQGRVLIGERPQSDVLVSLRDAGGKVLATTKTGNGEPKGLARGAFKFENVPVGAYAVASAKVDSSYGTAGVAPVQVEAKKTAKVTITMTKQVK